MRRRLFLKSMLGFWATFILIFESLWVVLLVYGQETPCERIYEQRAAPAQLQAAVVALQYGGPAALEKMMAALPEVDQTLFSAIPQDRAAAAQGHLDGEYQLAQAVAPDGTLYQVRRLTPNVIFPMGIDRRPFVVPLEVLLCGLLGGLGFSAAFAWYLTRPIRTFRKGFARLALGELHVRLQPEMGARRDELADLAMDFDAMAERIEKLVAARDQLLHDVSHELRSPLARLQVAVGLARQDPKNLKVTLDRVELESRRLDAMVEELLTLSRAESGVSQQCDYVNLSCLIDMIVADARFEAEPSGVQVESETDVGVDARRFLVKGRPQLLRRALENIVRNALQVSKAGQFVKVAVSLDQTADRFEVRIADEGPGLPEEALSSIFEPFVRGPKSVKDEGFGLGLAIARRLVLAHGGAIEAQNRAGGGLLVVVTLPVGLKREAREDDSPRRLSERLGLCPGD